MAQKGMTVQSIRFGDSTWEDIQQEAHREGVSASQFVREAAVARVWMLRGLRGETGKTKALLDEIERAREVEGHHS